MLIDGQLDILAVLAEEEARERSEEIGLTSFTTSSAYTPQELDDAARARYSRGDLGGIQSTHMWRYGMGGAEWTGAHMPVEMTADLRTLNTDHRIGEDHKWLPGPEGYLERLYCTECEWWTGIYDSRWEAPMEYLDHCWPGWRALPPIPFKRKDRIGAPKPSEVPADYPEEWKAPGAPSINWQNPGHTPPPTNRPSFIQGYSAFGGMGVGISTVHEYPFLTGVTP